MATSVPEPMAMPTSAWASAGASLMPSPTIATPPPLARSAPISRALASGGTSASTRSMPACARDGQRGRPMVAGEHRHLESAAHAAATGRAPPASTRRPPPSDRTPARRTPDRPPSALGGQRFGPRHQRVDLPRRAPPSAHALPSSTRPSGAQRPPPPARARSGTPRTAGNASPRSLARRRWPRRSGARTPARPLRPARARRCDVPCSMTTHLRTPAGPRSACRSCRTPTVRTAVQRSSAAALRISTPARRRARSRP